LNFGPLGDFEMGSTDLTIFYKFVVGAVLAIFWWFVSQKLTENPSLTIYIVGFSAGMLTVVTVVIQLTLRENVQIKMKQLLDSEISKRKEKIVKKINDLSIYLGEEESPSYSKSGVEGLEDDFKEFDSIKSKYTFQPKINHSAILMTLSSLILVVFWANPTLWVARAPNQPDVTLAHISLGFLAIGLWILLNILITSLEVKTWEK
jgi:pilus assembly protein TadC